jgi:hypothetical protein
MSKVYRQVASCTPSQREDVYVYAVAHALQNALVAITSADELCLLDAATLGGDTVKLQNVPRGLTALVVTDQGPTALCSSTVGTIAVFDLRSHSLVAQYQAGASAPALPLCRG